MQFKKINLLTFLLASCFSLFIFPIEQKKEVGLLIVATGKYIQFVETLIESAEKYFCRNHNVTYFIFTDGQLTRANNNIVTVYQQRLGWPYDTMMRCSMYYKHKMLYKNFDYLFATDADMLFVDDVGDEVLGERVATQHPGFVGKRGTYEQRSISTACVKSHEGQYYFAGGFYGGSSKEFLKINKTMFDNIEKDLEKKFIAVWHDESHLNRYFIDNKPTVILSPSYCYPEHLQLSYDRKLLALYKNHAQLRK